MSNSLWNLITCTADFSCHCSISTSGNDDQGITHFSSQILINENQNINSKISRLLLTVWTITPSCIAYTKYSDPPSPTLPSLIKTHTVSPTWVWKWSPTSARRPSSTPGTAEEHKSGIQQTDALNWQHHSHCVCGSVASRDTGQERHGLKLAVFNVTKQNIDTSIKYAHDHDTQIQTVFTHIYSKMNRIGQRIPPAE